MHSLDQIFRPQTVAAIGASDREGSVGYALMENLLAGKFRGTILPVNPGHRTIWNLKSYASVKKIPGHVDLAVIATPARIVAKVLEECGEAGIGGVVILSAGFKEAGEEGQERYEQLEQIVKKYKLRVIGPNCVGILNPLLGLNASFASRMALPGKIAFISQSGALCTAILDWSVDQSVGFSHFVSLGSMLDVDFDDLIDYFGSDDQTACILIYMESLKEARRFMSAARAFSRTKPIIVLKSGKSQEGAQASFSHTGSIAGNDAAFDAAFRRAGVLRVDTISQLFHNAQALAMQPRPRGNRLAIVTNAGGPAVLATDFLIRNHGKLATLSPATMRQLNKILPEAWSHNNPVDILGDTSAAVYAQSLKIVLADKNVDAVLVITAPQAVVDPTDIALTVADAVKDATKTVLAVWMGEQDVAQGREILEKADIPNYRYPEDAVDVFLHMHSYYKNLELLYETPPAAPEAFTPEKEAALELVQKALGTGKNTLSEPECKQLLAYYDLPIAPHELANSAADAAEKASRMGFPVVMKIVSPDIPHKTDAGGVLLHIQNAEEVRQSYKTILRNAKKYNPEAHITGILVEKMISKKYELLVGATRDAIFGPLITFGWGGVTVELLKDVSFGLPPLNMVLARQLMERTKVYELISGFRGMAAVDLEELQFMLVKFSYLLMDIPEIQEIDINPFAVDQDGGFVLDARISLAHLPEKSGGFSYDHLVISPYPAHFSKNIELKGGEKIHLRPIRPEDEPLEAELFHNLSRQSVYFRFFGYVPQVNHKFLIRFTQIDYDRELAIAALVHHQDRQEMIGVVRLTNDTLNETAEFAIVIADDWQGKGLGNLMMDYMLDIAKDRGLQAVTAEVLTSNHIMLGMLERRGFKVVKREAGSVRMSANM